MIKRHGSIISIFIALVLLCGTLVACVAPRNNVFGKGVLPKSGEIDAHLALEEIFHAWIGNNSYKESDVFGWDVGMDYTDLDDSNISVSFKGGLTSDNNDIFEFSIVDNKQTDEKSTVFSIICNKDASYINVLGKAIKIPELKVESDELLAGSEEDYYGKLNSLMNVFYLFANVADEGSTVEIIDKGDTYTKNYSLNLDLWKVIEALIGLDLKDEQNNNLITDMILEELGKLLNNNIVSINATVENIKLVAKIKEQGNDVFYSYSFRGGEVSPDCININLLESGDIVQSFKLKGLKILNAIPNIIIPNNAVEINLLKHQINGYFWMHDKNGNEIATYTYNLAVDLSAENFVANFYAFLKKDISLLIDSIFKSNDGRLLLEIKHTCKTNCIEHMSGKVNNEALLSVAYDPAINAFNNSNIYIAANVQALLPDNIFEACGYSEMDSSAIKAVLPADHISFVIDPMIYSEIEGLKHSPTNELEQNQKETGEEAKSLDEKETGIITLIKSLIGSFAIAEDDILTINYERIVKEIIGELNLKESTAEKINNILMSLFPNVTKMTAKATYVNEAPSEALNPYEEFNKDKSFSYNEKEYVPIRGEITNASNIISSKIKLYDKAGRALALSSEEIAGLLYNPQESENSRIEVSYTGIDGKFYKEELFITEIIGLQVDKKGPQTVDIILSGGLGSSIMEVLEGVDDVIDSSFLKKLRKTMIPNFILQVDFSITSVTDMEWTQEGVGNSENHLNTQKTNCFDDTLEMGYKLKITYENGEIKRSDTPIYPINKDKYLKENKINYYDDFTLSYVGLGVFYNLVQLRMDNSMYEDSVEVSLKEGEKYAFDDVFNNKTGFLMELDEDKALSAIKSFCEDKNNNAEFEVLFNKDKTIKNITVMFKQSGEYEIKMIGLLTESVVFKIKVDALSAQSSLHKN